MQCQACATSMYVTSNTASEGGGGPISHERKVGHRETMEATYFFGRRQNQDSAPRSQFPGTAGLAVPPEVDGKLLGAQ